MCMDWYCNKGLHDADIIDCQEYKCEYDFKNPSAYRNYLELTIDSKHALWDNSIKKLNFIIIKSFLN